MRRAGAADAGADDDLAAVDDHGPADLFDDALGQRRRLEPVLAVMVQDDEFVAAPTRDQIARTDDGAEPGGDLRQELVARAVAEAVVDLLEVVEIEKHDGDAVGRRTVGAQRLCELILEVATVGQLGDAVEVRHPVDPDFGVAPFRHVLDHQNPSLVLHSVNDGLDRATVPRLERNGDVRIAARAA